MAGSGGPEGFLYYSDSRKQQIVDQLIDNDVRAIYIHAVRSNGGDGDGNENPFIGSNPNSGVNPSVLDQWDSHLSQLDDAGIVTWFHLYDDGARPYGACNPDLPDGEKEFVKTRPHRSLGRATPAVVYNRLPKTGPVGSDAGVHYRLRRDRVDPTGKITIRHAGRLFHIVIGRAHARTPVIALIDDLDIRVIATQTGELLRHLTLDTTRSYQPQPKQEKS